MKKRDQRSFCLALLPSGFAVSLKLTGKPKEGGKTMNKIKQKTTLTSSILFHSLNPFGDLEWESDYYPTALVAAADLHEVFRLTQVGNHLSRGDRRRVQWLAPPGRSTMVGDVVVLDDGVWRFERFGYSRL